MSEFFISVLLILICGILDRYRGDKKDIVNRTFEKILYAATVAYLAGFAMDLQLLGFIAGFAVGISFGWGAPMGAYLNDRTMFGEMEWWQFGVFRKNALAALWLRGAIWAACLLPACIGAGIYSPVLAAALGFPLSCMIAKWCINNGYNRLGDRFGWQQKSAWNTGEFIRGLLVGGITRGLKLIV
jgi:hypothetical protein